MSHRARQAAIIAGAFAIVQLTQLNDYGATWDEPLHHLWGVQFLRFWDTGDRGLIEQMPGLGAYYGHLYYALNVIATDWAVDALALTPVAASHLLNVLVASAAPGLLFLLASEGFGARAGWFAAGFLILFPSFLAHAHYNPSDIPLVTCAVLVMCRVRRALTEDPGATVRREDKDAAVAGAAIGLAIAVKISAILLLPAIALAYGAFLFQASTRQAIAWPREARRVGVATAAAVVSVFLFWPSLWGDPGLLWRAVEVFRTHEFFTGTMLYLGARYGGAELPWHYTLFSLIMETPVLTLIAFGAGAAAAFHAIDARRNVLPFVLAAAWFAVPIVVSMKPGLIRYNGFRLFFFVVPALALLAGVGMDRMLALAEHRLPVRWRRVASVTAAGAVAAWLAIEIARVHPYQGSYVNEAVRLAIPRDIERVLPIEYWGATYKEGFEWLDRSAEPGSQVCVPIVRGLIGSYRHREDLTFGCDAGARYTMFMTSYEQTPAYESGAYELVFRIRRYESDLLRIYRLNGGR